MYSEHLNSLLISFESSLRAAVTNVSCVALNSYIRGTETTRCFEILLKFHTDVHIKHDE